MNEFAPVDAFGKPLNAGDSVVVGDGLAGRVESINPDGRLCWVRLVEDPYRLWRYHADSLTVIPWTGPPSTGVR